MTNPKLSRTALVFASVVILTATLGPQPTFAADSGLEEVVVTGSRIMRDPESYLGGMSIATGQDIEKIGSYATLDLLQRLPSVGNQGTGRNVAQGEGAKITRLLGDP